MNELREYFENNKGNLIDKWIHYFEIYSDVFIEFKDRPIVLLEIGVNHGGSLNMWKNYFHPDSKIFGLDINPECKKFEDENIEIFIGSQSDPVFLNNLKIKLPKIDILIDDGGHTMIQQITSFNSLFDHLNFGGVYLCEDTNTSYWPKWGGGVRIPSTYVEFMKGKIDSLNAWYSKEPNFKIDEFSGSIKSITFYSGVVLISKGIVQNPVAKKTGIPTLINEVNSSNIEFLSFKDRLKRFLIRIIEKNL